jgi:hypothetical protein
MLVGVALALAGCGSGTDDREDAATAAASRFSAAVARGDAAAACALLAEQTREELERSAERACGPALADEELPAIGAVRRADVYGGHAEVRGAGDTMFLTDLGGVWRVVAAGCQPRGDAPYECTLTGG